MGDLRSTQVLRNNEWGNINFTELKNGDIFRLFEPDGKVVRDKLGDDEFMAVSDPYLYKDEQTWMIDIQQDDGIVTE